MISALGIYLGFKNFDFSQFAKSLSDVNIFMLVLSIILQIVNIFFRAVRWKIILDEVKVIDLRKVFGATAIGYFGNNVFPFRMGEILRAYVLGDNENTSKMSIFGTVIVERTIDTIVFITIFLLALLLIHDIPVWINTIAIYGLILFVFLLVLGYIFLFIREKNYSMIVNQINKLDKGIGERILKLLGGLRSLIMVKRKVSLAFFSFLVWFLSILFIYTIGLSYNIYIGFKEIILLFFASSIAVSIPSAPGYIGTFHAGVIGVMLYLGYSRDVSQGFSIVLHGVGFVTLTLLGLYYFIKLNVRLRNVEIYGGYK
ncbi:MAG: flippase-like domain-containing protein [Candidatus Marinimicrobia bacterium]|nr:flippase-like domain-containing protein [Candidatus Neomarinimicrobiota bacterium]